ncbi:MAG: hypothetical protein R2789_12030 [Microthrixaceae bacterium]
MRLLGRGSVCINTGGEKVYPEEVESVLKDHPAVYDVVVVGVPHERWGEQVTAVVQLAPGVDPGDTEELLASMVAHARGGLAGYKAPVRSPSSSRSSVRLRERPTIAGPVPSLAQGRPPMQATGSAPPAN